MSDAVSPSPALTTQHPTPTEMTEQGQPVEADFPMGEEPTEITPPVPSNRMDRIANEEGKTVGEGAAGQPVHQSVETRDTNDVDVDMDQGEGTSNPESDEPSGSDATLSAKKHKPKPAFVKVMELKEVSMLTAYLEAFFGKSCGARDRLTLLPVVSPCGRRLIWRTDHFIYFKKSGGDLHGDISIDTIIYLEEPKKGGLLHLDPPINMPGNSRFGFQSPLPQILNTDHRFSSLRPRQRWIPEWEYDEDGEVIY